MAPHPSSIYTEQLHTVGEGDAIWFPEPHTSGEVQIGDVGYILEGAFVRLFNVISPQEYPVPDSDLPEGFEALQEPRMRCMDIRERALTPGHHNSKSVVCSQVKLDVSGSVAPAVNAGTTWEYTCRKEKGAVLILKNFATKKTAQAQHLFEKYAVKHYDSWAKYASEMTPNTKPVLVRGWVKTTADWTVTTFTSTGSKFTASIGGGVPGAGNVTTAITRQNSVHGPVLNRMGLYALGGCPADAPLDQCIFIRTCQVKRRQRAWNFFMRGGAGPDQLPDQRDANAGQGGPAVQVDDDHGDLGMTDVTPQNVPYGPMDAVLDYILENSEAEIAACCDEDLEFLLLGFDWPDDIAQWLRMNQPRIEVDDHGTGTLSRIDGINRRRSHLITFGIPSSTDTGVPDAPLPPINPEEARSNGLPQLNALAHGEMLLGTRSTRFLEWQHFMIKDNNTENGANLIMALSPNGKYIVTTCDDTTILLWNVPKARAIRRLEGHTDTVWTAAFSPDSTRLVSGSADTVGIVWDVETGTALQHLEGHSADVWTAVYSPDASKIATGSTDCTVKIWDANTGEIQYSFEDHFAHVMHVSFSPDSKLVASCADAVGIVWNATTGERIAELEGHQGAIWCMRFSHAGDRIITGSEDHTARVWDVDTGDELVTLHEHTSPVWSVTFAPDDAEIVSGSYDCSVVSCDSLSGELHHVFLDERNPSPIDTVAYSPSGDFLASGSADGHVRLWDAKTGEFMAEFHGHDEKVKSVVFTPDSSDIISSSEDGTVRGWNVHDVLRLY